MDLIRDAAKSLARTLGYDIRRTGYDFYANFYKKPIDFIRSRNVDLVVDVGANVGQYGEHLRKQGYLGRIVSFEPIGEAYQALAARASGDGYWRPLNMALGEREGTAEINVSEMSVFSSILSQTPAATAFHSQTRVTRSETIRVARLDDVVAELSPSKAAFLKIDTQGYERQVLLGASKCLSDFVGVQMELPITHFYEGTWRLPEAIAFMSERGFEISNIMPVNYDPSDNVSLVEVDCIFRRESNKE